MTSEDCFPPFDLCLTDAKNPQFKYSFVKERTQRHFHDFHLALYLCHDKTWFCGLHQQGAEDLEKSCNRKVSIKINMIVLFFFFFLFIKLPKQRAGCMTSSNTHCEWHAGMMVIGSQTKRQRGVIEFLSGKPWQRHVWQWVPQSCCEKYQVKRQNSPWEPPATLEIMQTISVICIVLALYFYISNRISAQMIEFDSMYFSSSCFRSQSTLYKICNQKWHCLDICTALHWCSVCSHWAAAGLGRLSPPALSISALNACKQVARRKESFVLSKGNICFLIFFLTLSVSWSLSEKNIPGCLEAWFRGET